MRRPGGLGGLLVTAAAMVLLTGCVKLDIHLKVASDDSVSGTYIVGVDKSLLAATNDDANSLYQRLTAALPTDKGISRPVTAVKYDDGTYVGAKFTVSAMPIAQMSALSGPDASSGTNFSLAHADGHFQFTGTLDTTSAAGPGGAAPTGSAIRLTVTFPGAVRQTNGHKDGSSVTWTPAFGQRVTVTATADDHGAAPTSPVDRVLYGVAGLSVLALLVVVAITLLARRQHGRRPPVF
jgi:hypothetical protein